MQNVWRADKPQKGRFREFMQCDADIIGSKNLINEYELIRIYYKVFEKLNLAGTIISINSRKILTAVASKLNVEDKFSEFVILLDKYDKIGKIKFIEELYLLSKKFIFLVIATKPASKYFEDGRNIHLTLKSDKEWNIIFNDFKNKFPNIETIVRYNE